MHEAHGHKKKKCFYIIYIYIVYEIAPDLDVSEVSPFSFIGDLDQNGLYKFFRLSVCVHLIMIM
jgi:hypothetical protein